MESASRPNRLRQARLAADLTQSELGRRTGFEQTQISKWENGRAGLSLATAVRLSAVLGCHAEDLYSAAGGDGLFVAVAEQEQGSEADRAGAGQNEAG
jgi:transcriptional regulator with XRE-family HTH domain